MSIRVSYDKICARDSGTSTTSTSRPTGGRELLGGKGIGLAEMTQLGVPVPAGFTITTDACRAYMRAAASADGLDEEIGEHIARLEEQTGKRFGDPADPLLVSVRSGAAVSMPGMMDTILNLGLNDDAVEGLARTTGNPRVRARLVPAADPDVRRDASTASPARSKLASVEQDVRRRRAREIYERSTTGTTDEFPQDPREQLRRAVDAVFESWNTRARRSTGARTGSRTTSAPR